MKMPFTKSPLEAKKASCEKLAQHLTEAGAVLAERQATVDRLADDGAIDKLDTAEAALRAAQDRVTTLNKAHVKARAEVEALEAEEIRLANERWWNEAGDQLEDIGNTFLKDIDGFGLALGRVIISAGRVRENIPHDGGLADLFVKLQTEIPVSVKMNLSELRLRVLAVRTGQATVAEPAPPPAPLPKPAPVVQVCVLKEGVAWTDSSGAIQIAARGADISLPPSLAEHAVKIGACCSMSDGRRRTIKQNYGTKVGRPLLRNCIKLNDVVDNEAEPFREPVLRSAPPNTVDPQFQIVPPSQLPPPRQVSVQGARHADLESLARNNKDSKP